MKRIMTTELAAHVGERVRIAGWIHHQRHLAQLSFLLLRDASGVGQVVIDDESVRGRAASMLPETVVEIEGIVVASAQAPTGVELHAPAITVLGEPAEAPPFEMRRPELNASLPSLLDHAAVSLRHPRIRAALAISAASLAGFRSTLDGMGFTEIQTPKIVGAATESGANVFALDYFGRPAYLAQSPQLYKQMMVGVFERVYETGRCSAPSRTTPRAISRSTCRSMSSWVSSTTTATSKPCCARCWRGWWVRFGRARRSPSSCSARPAARSRRDPPDPLSRRTTLLEAATGEQIVGEPDLAPAHERWLGEWALAEHGSDFLFVEGYPMAKRPFYTQPEPGRPEFSNSFDLLFRGLELVTGGQRLHRYDDYLAVVDAAAREALDGYLEAFRYGMPPHGGFAIGLERWTARVVGAPNVRQVTMFPRHQPPHAVGTSRTQRGLQRRVISLATRAAVRRRRERETPAVASDDVGYAASHFTVGFHGAKRPFGLFFHSQAWSA